MSKESLIEQRPESYDQLFRGELPYEPLAPEEQLGISGYSRNIFRAGARSKEINEHLNRLPNIVTDILETHQLESLDPESEEAIFCFIDEDDLYLVRDIVVDIFSQWEVASMRDQDRSVLSNAKSPPSNLVIETAAAVMQAKDSRYGLGDLTKKTQRQALTKLITSWGPEFTSQWMDGSIINWWLDQQELSEEEKEAWQDTFTPGIRTHFAVRNVSDPLEAIERVKTHLDETLTDENIAEVLGVSQDEVREVFTPSLRTRFAVGNIADPLKAVERVKNHLDTTLSYENIAKVLGVSQDKAREIFTPSRRTHFAVRSVSDPLKAIERVKTHLDETLTDRNIAEALDITEDEARDIFTSGIRTNFAIYYITDPLKAIERVKNHLDTTLSYENIAKTLNISESEARNIFTPGMRIHFAVGNIADPLKAVEQVKAHLDETLTDENIAEVLGVSQDKAREIFTPSIRTRLAFHNIADPVKAIKRVKTHLDETLTDENIAEVLGVSQDEVREVFTSNMRTYFAVNNTTDPLEAIERYCRGEITYSGRSVSRRGN